VDVGEDDVVRGRLHMSRRKHIGRNRHEQRARQEEQSDRRWRWLQHHEIHWRRRQEKQWRRWRRREVELWIAEHQHRPVDIDDFIWRRRRHIIIDHGECRRRLKRRR
jgi:hypothetical protein